MTQYNKTHMCAECPFRADALPGWLGPNTPEEVHQIVHGEAIYPCHVDIDQKLEQGYTLENMGEDVEHCVGMLRYRTSVIKHGRDPEQNAAQERLEKIKDKPLIPPFKFREYHKQVTLPKKRATKKQ